MDRLAPSARSDAYGSRINRAHSPTLAYCIPLLTVVCGSILSIVPIASAVPLMPPLGFITLLAWRMVRPGLFPIWAGFPLGMIDDLFSGQPFGSAIMLWSLALISVEVLEARFPWRGFIQDWLSAVVIITLYLLLGALLSGASLDWQAVVALVPQLLIAILLFPVIARQVARLDRVRLMRFWKIG
ncbi:rod shape-determining protein MreD [Altererythrobacter sp. RZ02]|uniref:Rod shape-determining protein MreD n=1 Tax=Pontixanthobacter rizhaonensis TaxID=2730337 RepID=A0A848QCL8_9SPHN|nr:rod shape-determining protein MreD [Pontixanthobacter rizhaonensis]NMW31351.1 rod shape-determining protein MreD [Pontixanthobacter rizhaonensis]